MAVSSFKNWPMASKHIGNFKVTELKALGPTDLEDRCQYLYIQCLMVGFDKFVTSYKIFNAFIIFN